MWRIRAPANHVRDSVDAGQDNRVPFLLNVSVVEGVFLGPLCSSEVAVAVLMMRQRDQQNDKESKYQL